MRILVVPTVMASIFAAGVGIGTWMLNENSLLPLGGGGWQSIVVSTVAAWILVFSITYLSRSLKVPTWRVESRDQEKGDNDQDD